MTNMQLTRYSLLLRHAADRLSHARSVEELRAGIAANKDAWARLESALDESDVFSDGDVSALRNHAQYVARKTKDSPIINDDDIEAFISINERVCDLLVAHTPRARAVERASLEQTQIF